MINLIWLLVSSGLLITKWINVSSFISLLTIGLSFALILYILEMRQDTELAITMTALISVLSAGFKYLFTHQEFINGLDLSVKQSMNLLASKYPAGSKEYEMFSEIMVFTKEVYLSYNYSISVFLMIVAAWIGIILYNRQKREMYHWYYYQTYNFFVYVLIAGMALSLYEPLRVVGLNVLIGCSALFLIQGLTVFWYLFKDWFNQSKILIAVAVLSLLLNPYLLVFTALFGLLDMWYDFRKLNTQEETHEDNIN